MVGPTRTLSPTWEQQHQTGHGKRRHAQPRVGPRPPAPSGLGTHRAQSLGPASVRHGHNIRLAGLSCRSRLPRKPGTAPQLSVCAPFQNPCSHALFGVADPPHGTVCDQSVPDRAAHPPNSPNKKPRFCGAFPIGAPGFEPGTSPTRIMGEIAERCKKSLQTGGSGMSSPSSQILGYCRGFPGFRQRDRVAAQWPGRGRRLARRRLARSCPMAERTPE